MTVKEPIPCSFFDIPGLQSWLDEMALQGLFLQKFNYHWDRAIFTVGDPYPVRYRLDPVGRSKKKDRERAELYQEMGWTRVTTISKAFHIFSCGDPDAPELYSDPQSLSLALRGTIRAQIRLQLVTAAAIVLLLGGLLFWARDIYWADFLLWVHPQNLFTLAITALLFPGLFLAIALDLRKLFKIRRTLAQGLPLKAKKRWNRPRWILVWLAVYLPLTFFPKLFLEDFRPEICGLDEATLSHPWPTLGRLEGTGPHPLAEEPEVDGYATQNDSWFVPVQEFASTDWRTHPILTDIGEIPGIERPYALWMYVQYDRARSPRVAQWVYQIRRDDEAEALTKAQKYDNPFSRVTGLQPWEALDWPGLDRLEAAHYRQQDQDCWTLTALRGDEVLVVRYVGYAELEDCLPLFLDALAAPQ